MKLIILLLCLVYAVTSLHVRIPAANKTVLDQLYGVGITVGEQGDTWWDVYLENYKLDLLTAITTYENIVAKKAVVDMTGYTCTSYGLLYQYLGNFTRLYPTMAKIESIGSDTSGRPIFSIVMSQYNSSIATSVVKKKKIKYVANLHGDDVIGREMLLKLVKYMLENYETDTDINHILNNYEVHIVPSANPTGLDEGTRTNRNGVDINTNFPDKTYGQITAIQKETTALKAWSIKNQFSLGGILYGNKLLVSYPHHSLEALAADELFLKTLAKSYSLNHDDIKINLNFTDGVTNGASNEISYGTFEDWDYMHTKCLTLSIGMSLNKHPDASELDAIWLKNKVPLIKFMRSLDLF